MFLVQRIFTRTSADVAFYTGTTEFNAYYNTAYKATQKILSHTSTVTEDKLKMVLSTMWKDEETWNEYQADPTVIAHISARNAYNTEHNITSERLTSQV
jgi:hypothetical protein